MKQPNRVSFLAAAGLFSAVFLFSPLVANAALVTVGSNASTCDYTSLAFAIAFSDSGDTLMVEGKTWTHISDVNFNLLDKSLFIEGGFDGDCTLTDSGSPTTLQGLGQASVLTISSDTAVGVFLSNLVIQGGDAGGGGGVHISGDVAAVMTNVVVRDNQAGIGGGIWVEGSSASLLLGTGSRVEGNTALGSGGGVACSGDATVDIQPGTAITGNWATEGGGLNTFDCYANLTASGAGQVLIGENQATMRGGGIHAGGFSWIDGEGGRLTQLAIYDNTAESGGGVSVEGGNAVVHLTRAAITGNRADFGGGVFVDGAAFFFHEPESGDCAFDSCNYLLGNGSFPDVTLGGAFHAFDGYLSLRSTLIQGNNGQQPIGRLELDSDVLLEGGTVTGNDSVAGFRGFFVGADSDLTLRGVTFADQTGMSLLLGGSGTVDADSMIAAGVPSDLFDPQLTWDLDCAVLTDGLPGGPYPWVSNVMVIADPGFVDRVGGDLHLQASSPAVDLCAGIAVSGVDTDGESRPQGAVWDAGGDETETPIFTDGFESGDLSAWTSAQ